MNEYEQDHDFNNQWGSLLGTTELDQRHMANTLALEYFQDPINVSRKAPLIMAQYVDMFENYFNGILPISLHSHVTDALCPTTIASMLLSLAVFSSSEEPAAGIQPSTPQTRPNAIDLLGWSQVQLQAPRWLVAENCYGACYGPLSSLSIEPQCQDITTGPSAIRLMLRDRSVTSLKHDLCLAKKRGCIGVLVEIASNTYKGPVTTPAQLEALSAACAATGLLLAIDETLTAIRCGAPFAYQRTEYAALPVNPDLVFFGKALGVSGTGINFQGQYLQRLSIRGGTQARRAIIDWQKCVTQAIQVPVIIDALGVLEMAVAGGWVLRSRVIGAKLREMVLARARQIRDARSVVVEEGEVLGGLDSFIFVRAQVAASFLVMGAGNPGPHAKWVRWLPRLDLGMTSEKTLETILHGSRAGAGMRMTLSKKMEIQGLAPAWCFYCGDYAINREQAWCRACCVNVCTLSECLDALESHACLAV